jgi:DNA polymerase III delta prime subunit
MNTPWVEKYRPSKLEDIAMSDENRLLFKNMVKKSIYPNMIFYGNPGTGKTTTILCLIKRYQNKFKCKNNSLHLNASHHRGIDVIRNDIQDFVSNKNFFDNHKRFVLLDEADSMTKQAQYQLHNIMKNTPTNVCFIIICNFMNKIIEPIRESLMIVSFNNVTKMSDKIIKKCVKSENVKITKKQLDTLKQLYDHDFRSLMNTLQDFDNHENTNTTGIQFFNDRYLKTLCVQNTQLHTKLYNLYKAYNMKTVMYHLFKYICNNYNVDIKLMKMIKYSLLHDDGIDYIENHIIPYLNRLNKIE